MKMRLLSIVLVCVLVIGMLPMTAFANMPQIATDAGASGVYTNPMYDVPEDLERPQHDPSANQPMASSTVYTSVASAGVYLREKLVDRADEISFTCKLPSSSFAGTEVGARELVLQIFEKAIEHTGVPDEGDYLLWNYRYYFYDATWQKSGSYYQINLSYQPVYYTNAEQEEKVADACTAALKKMKVSELPNFEKIFQIYKYVVDTVSYDYENLYDETYLIKHSAYAAIIDQTAVCQGYATLLYRMLLEAGIDSRVIAGEVDGVPHGWNIVKLKGNYYYLDATFDDTYLPIDYDYFLKAYVGERSLYEEYYSVDFLETYPLAHKDFVSEANYTLRESQNFQYYSIQGKALVLKYTGSDANITVPSKLGGYPVVGVCERAFANISDVKSIVFSEGIKYISMAGDTAIYQCNRIQKLSFPASLIVSEPLVTSFLNSFYLNQITIASGNQYLCEVDSVVFTEDMSILMHYPCKKANVRYEVPESVVAIWDNAFDGSSFVKEIVLPDGIIYIGENAFRSSYNLCYINIPEECIYIGDQAFARTELRSVRIPKSLQYLGERVFQETPLEKITIASGSTHFELIDGVLYYKLDDGMLCLALYPSNSGKQVYEMPDNVVTMYPYVMFQTTNLREIYLGKSLKNISYCAFSDNFYLDRVYIPRSVEVIEGSAFEYTKPEMYYQGTEDEWDEIEVADYLDSHEFLHFNISDPYNHSTVTDVVEYEEGAGGKYEIRKCDCGREYTANSAHFAYIIGENGIISATEGQKVRVCLNAGGDGLTYNWYFKDKGSDKFYYTSTYKENNYSVTMTPERDGRQVYCVVVDQHGNSDQSEVITLTMAEGLQITKQPEDASSNLNKTVKVGVEATGEGLTYQWFVKNADSDEFIKSSNRTATYATKMTEKSHGREIYCVVYDIYGNAVQTDTVRLYMNATILTQPETTYAQYGEAAKVKVVACGDGLTYQWYVKDAGSSKFSKSSVTSATYSAKMTEKTKDRYLYCVVTDQYGNSVKTDTVQLHMAASITTQPKTTYAKYDTVAKVSLKAAGDGLTYQWYVKNAGSSKYVKSSVTSATYSTRMNDKSKDRYVYCIVTDQYGNTVKSNTVRLRAAATIVTQPKDASAANGSRAVVSVKAVGDGLTYKWYYKNAGATKFTLTSTYTGTTYGLTMNEDRDGRQVYCVITDKYGNSVKSEIATLSMK